MARGRGPPRQFHIGASSPIGSRFFVAYDDTPISRFVVGESRSEASTSSTSITSGESQWCVEDNNSQVLFINFNWPLPNIRGKNFVHDAPEELVVPNWPKPSVFYQCQRVYGNPAASNLLPREEFKLSGLKRYSPESRRIMDLCGFYSDEPHASGYGTHIPVPLEAYDGPNIALIV